MQITVNGKIESLASSMTVADFIMSKKLVCDHVVVELNRQIIGRTQYTDLAISDGDSLEILNFVGGG